MLKNQVITEEYIKADDINILLTTLTDVYVTILENGLVTVEYANIQFRSNHTKEFFVAGLQWLKQSKLPDTVEFFLNFLLIQETRKHNTSIADLFEMYLLTKIIPILLPEGACIKKYIDYLVEFCTEGVQHKQIVKFIKYIDIYKITDCHVLEITRTTETNKI
jgi:hypothetical protein